MLEGYVSPVAFIQFGAIGYADYIDRHLFLLLMHCMDLLLELGPNRN